MTATQIEQIKKDLEAARARKDGVETARLYFSLPLSERNQQADFVRRVGPPPRLVGGSSAGPAARASLPRAPVAQAEPLVVLGPSVRHELRNVDTGCEDGFWLIASTGDSGRVIEIRETALPARDADRGWDRIMIHTDEAERLNERLRPRGFEVIGHAHSQPSNAHASDADFTAWANIMQGLGCQRFIGLVTMDQQTARDPFIARAYVLSKQSGAVVHQEASIHYREH